jgi:hypothetical protein
MTVWTVNGESSLYLEKIDWMWYYLGKLLSKAFNAMIFESRLPIIRSIVWRQCVSAHDSRDTQLQKAAIKRVLLY